MASKSKIFTCAQGHKMISNVKNEKRLVVGKIVCGSCGTKFSEYRSSSWSSEKHFLCNSGHVITITPFDNGECNFTWGNGDKEFVNVSHSPEKLSEMLRDGEVMCPAGSPVCNQTLIPLEGCNIVNHKLMIAKTRTTVGDIWDKQHYPEPKMGNYDTDFNYQDTDFSKRIRERVKKLRKTRNNKPIGEIINRSTKRNYRNGERRPTKLDL